MSKKRYIIGHINLNISHDVEIDVPHIVLLFEKEN